MPGHAAKFNRKQREAIDALLEQPTVAEAARVVDITPQMLGRWMQEPAFETEFVAAKTTRIRQQKARLRQGALGAAASMIELLRRGKPATRLQAGLDVIRFSEQANEIEALGAAVAQRKRAIQASQPEAVTGERGRPPAAGHGAKYPRRKEEAITQLLRQRSVAHAARAAGIGTQTLYRWLKDPAFDAAYRATARAVFAPAMMLLQNQYSEAVTIVRNFSRDTTIPETTRGKATRYVLEETQKIEMEEQEARLAELLPATASCDPLPETAKTSGLSFHQKLKRLRALLPASRQERLEMIFAHAVDGRPAGSSIVGPDGRHVWLDPPEGCQKGEPVEDDRGPVQDSGA
jgi:Helix-turn-helix domain